MGRKLVRILLALVVLQVVAAIVGKIMSKKMTRGDESSDDFQVAAIMGGKKFESHARDLKSGVVIASMGGVEVDLRDATLDSSGADLELRSTMGGVQVTIPEDWAVALDEDTKAGEFQLNVPAADDLPQDAPQLRIHAVTRMGGGLVTTGTK